MTSRNIPEVSNQIDRHQNEQSTGRLRADSTGKTLSTGESLGKQQGGASNDSAQSILDRSRLQIDNHYTLARADDSASKTNTDKGSKSTADAAKQQLDLLKAFDSNFGSKLRSAPDPNKHASDNDARAPFVPQIPISPLRPNIPGLPVDNRVPDNRTPIDTSRQPEIKPAVSTSDIEKKRQELTPFAADSPEDAARALKTAKELGLPLVVRISVDEQSDYSKKAEAAFVQLAGGEVNGKDVKGTMQGKAVFLTINAGGHIGDEVPMAEAEAMAKSIGIRHFSAKADLVKRVPYTAVIDTSSTGKPWEKQGHVSASEIKTHIPEPTPVDKIGK